MGKLLYNDNMFNRIMSKVFDLILLGTITILCSLPVITAGAALLSAYRIMLDMADNTEGPIIKSYFTYFRRTMKNDFKDSLKGWFIILIVYAVLITDLFLLTKSTMEMRSLLYGVTIVMMVNVISISDWYFALKATFNEGSIKTLKNAAGFFMVYLMQSLMAGVYTVAAFYILSQFPYLIGIVLIFGGMLLKYPIILLYQKKIHIYLMDRGIETGRIESDDVEVNDGGYDVKYDDDDDDDVGEVFKKMSPKQKAEYIITYYRMHIAACCMVLLIIGIFVYQVFFKDHRDCFQVAVVNAYIKESDVDISDRLSDTLVEDTSRERVYFDTQYQIEYPGVKNMMADTSFQEKLLMNIGVGEVDVAILPMKFVDFCNETEFIFRDVSTILDEDTMSRLADSLIYTKDEDGHSYPCGVVLSDTEFLNAEDFTFIEGSAGDKAVMTFPINAYNDRFCNQFAMEILDEE